ncbi:L-arabinolactonase [Planctomycetes bacterium CA13]|uniref:L-arabinolactonase n=1 Tax=Novipirellula herctigrandis TaxID=2527986 RepID=A0A5C5ZCG5_9BACT|nr:L-arabinolactonase [Planctomycetes bacterium CA13]
MKRKSAELLYDGKAELAEGPLWHNGSLWWVNIETGELNRFDVNSGRCESRGTGDLLGAAVPTDDGRWLLARRDQLQLLDWETGKVDVLNHLDFGSPNVRFNDGKCDAAGRFWIGSMSLNGDTDSGAFYCLNNDGKVVTWLTHITISNGLGWTSDCSRMFYVDTPTQRIDVLDFDLKHGKIENRRPLVEIPRHIGFPDGLTVDADDNVWVALWGGSAVHCYDGNTGKQIDCIAVPAPQVTACCFGGDDLNELFITTAKTGLDNTAKTASPLSGGVFRCPMSVKGTASHPFRYQRS